MFGSLKTLTQEICLDYKKLIFTPCFRTADKVKRKIIYSFQEGYLIIKNWTGSYAVQYYIFLYHFGYTYTQKL